ncbi:putative phosphoprotein [Anisopteromalus calandrae negative-strand RNA virus 1]|uniref:Phosphoprotein n=1 Tax=Anisopteromalus calandrae negative-strand RNA virus 1 TaxID=2848909 RepID=A0AAE7RZM1_9MONO|nr:putative phosphoprotein [Anisopteromalus calandrae negative-strand RNA virus 1]QWT43282.1 putative phosphoprotein [Anisopteromalus calandrae negative-strand RNA virus 1]
MSCPPPVNRNLKPLVYLTSGFTGGYIMGRNRKSTNQPSPTSADKPLEPTTKEDALDLIDQYHSANTPLTDQHLEKCIRLIGVQEDQLADRVQEAKIRHQKSRLQKEEDAKKVAELGKKATVNFDPSVAGASGVDIKDAQSSVDVVPPGSGHFGEFEKLQADEHPRALPLLTDPTDTSPYDIALPDLGISDSDEELELDDSDSDQQRIREEKQGARKKKPTTSVKPIKLNVDAEDPYSHVLNYLAEILSLQRAMEAKIQGLEDVLYSQVSVLVSKSEDLANNSADLKVTVAELSNSVQALTRRLALPSVKEAVVKRIEPSTVVRADDVFKRKVAVTEKNLQAITEYLLQVKVIKPYEVDTTAKMISSLDMEDIEWHASKLGKELTPCEKSMFYEWDGKSNEFIAQVATMLKKRSPLSENEIKCMEKKQTPSHTVKKTIDKTVGTNRVRKTKRDILNMF